MSEGFPAPSQWQVQSINGEPAPSGGDQVIGTVVFSAGEVSGIGGCNRYEGTYSAQPGGVVGNGIGISRLTATEMGCSREVQPFEEQMFDVLTGAALWSIAGNDQRLFLSGSEGGMVLLPMLTAGE